MLRCIIVGSVIAFDGQGFSVALIDAGVNASSSCFSLVAGLQSRTTKFASHATDCQPHRVGFVSVGLVQPSDQRDDLRGYCTGDKSGASFLMGGLTKSETVGGIVSTGEIDLRQGAKLCRGPSCRRETKRAGSWSQGGAAPAAGPHNADGDAASAAPSAGVAAHAAGPAVPGTHGGLGHPGGALLLAAAQAQAVNGEGSGIAGPQAGPSSAAGPAAGSHQGSAAAAGSVAGSQASPGSAGSQPAGPQAGPAATAGPQVGTSSGGSGNSSGCSGGSGSGCTSRCGRGAGANGSGAAARAVAATVADGAAAAAVDDS